MNLPIATLEHVGAADREEFGNAVLSGLSSTPRAIPARFLYDARGSALFDAICELPEYYLTRTETAILGRCAAEIAQHAGPDCALVEFGSGSSVKSRLLLDAMSDLDAYVPIDISREHLDETAARLRRDYPRLRVEPVCADYMALDALPTSQRLAISLRYLDGLSVPEIARELSKSVHAVESLLARGRATFKQHYLEHGHA